MGLLKNVFRSNIYGGRGRNVFGQQVFLFVVFGDRRNNTFVLVQF